LGAYGFELGFERRRIAQSPSARGTASSTAAEFRVTLMASSRPPVFPDKIVGIAMIGWQPDTGWRNELLVGTLPCSVQDQAGTHRDDECSSYGSKEGTHEHPPVFEEELISQTGVAQFDPDQIISTPKSTKAAACGIIRATDFDHRSIIEKPFS
jgi:hypothetical protein